MFQCHISFVVPPTPPTKHQTQSNALPQPGKKSGGKKSCQVANKPTKRRYSFQIKDQVR